MRNIEIQLKGTTTLIMHSDALADPLSEGAQKMRELHDKKKKTDDDHREIEKTELRYGVYWDDELGVYIPQANIMKCLIESARMSKNGRAVERGVYIVESKIPLQYEHGPKKTLDDLVNDPRLKLRKTVVVRGQRIVRTRPAFPNWSCRFHVIYDENMIKNENQLIAFISNAGQYVGIGNLRIGKGGKMGQFEAAAV